MAYRLVADGGVFAFSDAVPPWLEGAEPLVVPLVGMAAMSTGQGR